MGDSMSDTEPPSPSPPTTKRLKLLVGVSLLVAFALLFFVFREHLTLKQLAAHEQSLLKLRDNHLVLVVVAAAALYVLVTGFSIPGATVLSLLYAWYFGFWPAVVLISFASTTGATVSFLLSRYLFRSIVQRRFAKRFDWFNEALEREGKLFLFALRLTPVVPFVVINLVMGLTRMRVWTFWWVSQIGMLPGTCVYAYAGSSAPSLQLLAERGTAGLPIGRLLFALFLLGLFPLAMRWLMKRFVRRPGA